MTPPAVCDYCLVAFFTPASNDGEATTPTSLGYQFRERGGGAVHAHERVGPIAGA